jgi:hypothetical protein
MPRLLDVLTLPPRASAGYRKRASLDLLWTRRHVEVRGPLLSRSVFGSGEVDRLWVTRALYVGPQPWWRLGRGREEHWLHVHWSARRNRQPVTLGAQVADPDELEGLPWLAADACVPCLEGDLRALLPCLRLLGGTRRTDWPDACWQHPTHPLRRGFPDAATAEADARRALIERGDLSPTSDPSDNTPTPVTLRGQVFGSLYEAIAAAEPDDILFLGAADYLLHLPLTLTKPISIIGEGPTQTRILGSTHPHILRFEGRARFQLKGVALVVLQDEPADALQAAAGAHVDIEACNLIGAIADPSADPNDTSPLGCGARFESGVTGSIRGCRLLDNARHGLLLNDDAAVDVLRCRAERNGLDGLLAAASAHPHLLANTARHNGRHGLALIDAATPSDPILQHQLSYNRACGVLIAGGARPSPLALDDCACEHNGAAGLLVGGDAAATASRLFASDNHGDGARARDRAHLTLSFSRTLRSGRHGVHVSGDARVDLSAHQSSRNAGDGCRATDAASLSLCDTQLTYNAAHGALATDRAALHVSGACVIESNAADGLRAILSLAAPPPDVSGTCRVEMNGGFGFALSAGRVQGALTAQNALGGFLIAPPQPDASADASDAPQDPQPVHLSRVEARQHEGGPGLLVRGRGRVEASAFASNAVGVLAEGDGALALDGCDITRNAGDGLRLSERAQVTSAQTRCHRNAGVGVVASEDAALTWHSGDAASNGLGGVQATERARASLSNANILQNRAWGARVEGAASLTLQSSRVEDNFGSGLIACDDARAIATDCAITQHHADGVRLEGSAHATLQQAHITYNRADGVRLESSAHATLLRSTLSHNGLDGAAADGSARFTMQATASTHNDRHGLSLCAHASAHAEDVRLHHNRACGADAFDNTKLKLVEVSALYNQGDGLSLRDAAAVTASSAALDGNQGCGLRLRDRAQATLDASTACSNRGNGADLDDAASLLADRLQADRNQGHGLGAFGASRLDVTHLEATANQRHGLIVGDRAAAKGRHIDALRNGGDGLSLQSATPPAFARVRAASNQGCGLRITATAHLEGVHTADNIGPAGAALSVGATTITQLHSERDRVGVLVTHDAAPSLHQLTAQAAAEFGVWLTDRSRPKLEHVTATACKRHGVLISREAQARIHTLRCALNHQDGLHICDSATAQVLGFTAESNTLSALCLRDTAALTLAGPPPLHTTQDPTARLLTSPALPDP